MVVVAVGAHPDDIEFGCYGTLAKLRENHEVYLYIFTHGELGGHKWDRLKEAKESASLINAELKMFNYNDGDIPITGDTVQVLTEQIRDLNPSMVFTLFPHDTHQDHRAVSAVTVSSCRTVPTLLFYEIPHTNNGFLPNYYVDISDTFPMKEKALSCFKSQQDKPYLHARDIRALAQYRAYSVFHPDRLFEAFMLHRHIHEV